MLRKLYVDGLVGFVELRAYVYVYVCHMIYCIHYGIVSFSEVEKTKFDLQPKPCDISERRCSSTKSLAHQVQVCTSSWIIPTWRHREI